MAVEPILRDEYFPTDKFNSNFAQLDTGKADRATTLAGYGIADAYTIAEIDGELVLISGKLSEVEAIAKEASRARVFDTYADMLDWLSDPDNTAALLTGDKLLLRELDVPDYWWDGAQALELETGKVDLSNIYTMDEVNALLAGKANAAHTHSAGDIATGTMSPARIAQDAANRFVSDAQMATWNAGGTGAVTYATPEDAVQGTATDRAMSPATVLHAIQNLAIGALGTLTNAVITASDSVKSALQKLQGQINEKEPKIALGSSAQYMRGDKTWQTLNAAAVGLGNVANESKTTMFTNAALTGIPTAPTASAGTNTQQIANTAFVQTALAAGGLKSASGSYVGTGLHGASNPNSLTFPFVPKWVSIISQNQGNGMDILNSVTRRYFASGGGANALMQGVTWNGTTVTWYTSTGDANQQLNTSGSTYHYLAIS